VLVIRDNLGRTFGLLVNLRVEARIMNLFAGVNRTSTRSGITFRTYPPIVTPFLSLLCGRELLPRNR
jgi:hypothetical protein